MLTYGGLPPTLPKVSPSTNKEPKVSPPTNKARCSFLICSPSLAATMWPWDSAVVASVPQHRAVLRCDSSGSGLIAVSQMRVL